MGVFDGLRFDEVWKDDAVRVRHRPYRATWRNEEKTTEWANVLRSVAAAS